MNKIHFCSAWKTDKARQFSLINVDNCISKEPMKQASQQNMNQQLKQQQKSSVIFPLSVFTMLK